MSTYSKIKIVLKIGIYLIFGITIPSGNSQVWAACSITSSPTNIALDNFVVGTDRLVAYQGNIGIGTTTPQARLEIAGGTNDGTTSTLRVFDSVGNNLLNVINDGDIDLSDSTKTNGGIYFNANTTINSDLFVDGSANFNGAVTFQNTANLGLYLNTGIGTDASSTSRVIIKGQNSGSTDQALVVKNSDCASSSDSPCKTLLFAQNDGLVGIGTASPTETLDINGGFVMTGVGAYILFGKQTGPPAGCDLGRSGSIALTNKYTICVCTYNTSTSSGKWVSGKDGAKACVWS